MFTKFGAFWVEKWS